MTHIHESIMPVPPDTNSGARRIFLAEDHAFFRAGMVAWINQQPGFACCGEAETCAAAREAIGALKPDLAIVDLNLKGGDGLELVKQLVAEHPSMPILVISQGDELVFAERALRAGAKGYLMKEEAVGAVLTAICGILQGQIHLSRRMASRLIEASVKSASSSKAGALGALTDRELQVFQLIGGGMGPSQIAAFMSISVKTIETYRENIKNKLGLRDGTALKAAARRWVQEGKAPPPLHPPSRMQGPVP